MSERENLAEVIFGEPDRPVIGPIPTPEWSKADGKVYVRGLSGDQRDQFETAMAAASESKSGRLKPNTSSIRARLVALGCCDKDGEVIFTIADLQKLGKKSAVVLDRLYDAIRKASGMGATEDAEKNSETTTGEGSS